MHIGAAAADLTQAGRLERMLHLDHRGKKFSTTDVGVRKADVMKAVIGEIPTAVALRACRLGVEEHESPLCFFRNGLLVTVDPCIERRIAGNHSALVGGNGLCDVL